MASTSRIAEGGCPGHSGSSPPGPHHLAGPRSLPPALKAWPAAGTVGPRGSVPATSVQWLLRQFSQVLQLGPTD